MLALVACHEQPLHRPSRDHVEARLDATCRVWERWLGFWDYDGPWEDEVARSALALKLLVYAPNGSIAAAPTTSLPEVIGGDKNYDYRYSWVRDSAFTLDALMRLGLPEQVQESFACLLRAVRRTAPDLAALLRPRRLRAGPQRDARPPARLPRLGARPLRERGAQPAAARLVGRPARDGFPLRVRGERARRRLGGDAGAPASTGSLSCGRTRTPACGSSTSTATTRPPRPRSGWRSTARSAWPREGQLPAAHVPQWREQHDRLHTWIEERCWSEELGAYRGWPGEESLDAGILRTLRMDYPEREHLDRSVDTIRERLAAAPGLLYRTSEHVGREGAFVACSFWLVGGACAARPRRRGLRDDGADPPVRERPRALLGGDRSGERRAARELPAGAEPPRARQRRGCRGGR